MTSTRETEEDWMYFEDPDEEDSTDEQLSKNAPLEFTHLPAQLHPAISAGCKRVSSCYFSIGSDKDVKSRSMVDLLSLLGDDNMSVNVNSDVDSTVRSSPEEPDHPHGSADVLYHDILMHVFTFLDASSLSAFSETARRPNFEVFYFLQLQLQRAVLLGSSQNSLANGGGDSEEVNELSSLLQEEDSLAAIAGTSCLARLASLDLPKAQAVVDRYLKSNSTLRTLPLSHSLAYFRMALKRSGFHQHFQIQHPNVTPSHALASAALLVTAVGAAVMTGSAPSEAMALADSFGTELPNMLFRVGFVGSALVATRKMSTELASTDQKSPQSLNNDFPSSLRLHEGTENFRIPSLAEVRRMLQARIQSNSLMTPESVVANPYEHLESIEEMKNQDGDVSVDKSRDKISERKIPSGSVGAYSRAIYEASNSVKEITKERRKAHFLALSVEEQRHLSLVFLDACSSDDTLHLVEEMIHTFDVDGFYQGPDDSETCALHTAAFHGAARVLEFLCKGIDYGYRNDDRESRTETNSTESNRQDQTTDGGLCDVNIQDSNGWTALHFAAGANSVTATEILASRGAQLDILANNGYTPVAWATRLSNEEVATKLKECLAERESHQHGWIMSQPLTQIASRFFSLIPS